MPLWVRVATSATSAFASHPAGILGPCPNANALSPAGTGGPERPAGTAYGRRATPRYVL